MCRVVEDECSRVKHCAQRTSRLRLKVDKAHRKKWDEEKKNLKF